MLFYSINRHFICYYQGKETYLRNKILESDITLHIGKHELELALRLNSAVYNGDLYRAKRFVAAGVDPNKTDYDGRTPLVLILKYFFFLLKNTFFFPFSIHFFYTKTIYVNITSS